MSKAQNNSDLMFIDSVLDSVGNLPKRVIIICGDMGNDEPQYLDTKLSDVMELYGENRLPYIGFSNIWTDCSYDNLSIIQFSKPTYKEFRGGFCYDGKRYPVRFIPKDSYVLNYIVTQPWENRAGFFPFKWLVKQNVGSLSKGEASYELLPPFDKASPPHETALWAQFYLGTAFDVYHRWQVGVRRKGVEICFPFLRGDIKEIYRLRDVPDGKLRRSALKTIVSRYGRTIKETGDIVEVREHFRNTNTFSMDGETYTIYPSLDDKERINSQIGAKR